MEPFTSIISTAELANHLSNPRWVIVDCRFDLAKPDWGQEAYLKEHIPGAVYAHLDRDLSGEKNHTTGRHPLPDDQKTFAVFSRLGIGQDTQVVAYDQSGGAWAGRLWWMLRLYGHRAAAVLDGGFPRWLAEGRPTISGIELNHARHFTGTLHSEMLASVEDAARAAHDVRVRLVDARAPERFRGEVEPIDPVAGHIPGAVNRFHGQNLTAEGLFKPPEELRKEFTALLDGAEPQNAIVYCGSGVTSIHHLLAMEAAGLPGAKLFVGSWSQWIRDPQRPVARGVS